MWVLAILPWSVASLQLSHHLLDLHRYLLCVLRDAFLNLLPLHSSDGLGAAFSCGRRCVPRLSLRSPAYVRLLGVEALLSEQRPCVDLGALSPLLVATATFRTLPRTRVGRCVVGN